VSERVVFLHSSLGDRRLWARQVDLLRERGYDALAPDLPGYGTEPMPRERFSFVEHVARLLPAILVGNSFGGAVALRTALAYPDRVPKLVLVNSGFPDHEWSEEMRDYWRREEEAFEQGDLDLATQVNLDEWLAPELHELVRPMQRRALELQSEHEEPQLDWPELAPLSTLAMPTLVILGERDKDDFIAIGERIAREAPNARLAMVADAGHVLALDQPEAFERLLLEFLDSDE
jgi:3-oxoadipate enol-lactonase